MADNTMITKVSENFSKVMDSLGNYLKSVGNIEKEDPDFKDFINKMKHEPEYFDTIMSNMPPEMSNELLSLFVKMMSVQSRAKDIDKLEPEEKISLGESLIGIGKDFEELSKKISKEDTK